jgi:hypothetical protein
VLGLAAALAGGVVLAPARLLALVSAAQQPLTFAIDNSVQRLTTVRTTKAGVLTMRTANRLEASRPVAQTLGKKILDA